MPVENEVPQMFEAGDLNHGGVQASALNLLGVRPTMFSSPMAQYPMYMPSTPLWFHCKVIICYKCQKACHYMRDCPEEYYIVFIMF